MFAGWRMSYVTGAERERGCLFCRLRQRGDDRERLVLARRGGAYLMLNAFPYNTGHLMVAVGRHVGTLAALAPAERRDLWALAALGESLLAEVYHPSGMNVGANLGRAAGAGVGGHLHLHLVPRWSGDTNFMAAVADTKVLPEALSETYRRLLEALRGVRGGGAGSGRARRSPARAGGESRPAEPGQRSRRGRARVRRRG
jgi:ATP adenylyltransferase